MAAIELLAEMPIGRASRVAGTYEKPVTNTSLIVVYRVSDENLYIVRIIHAKRDWPNER